MIERHDGEPEIVPLRSLIEDIRTSAARKFAFFIVINVILYIIGIFMTYFFEFLNQGQTKTFVFNLINSSVAASYLIVCFGFNLVAARDIRLDGDRIKAARVALYEMARGSLKDQFVEREWKILGEISMRARYSFDSRIYTFGLFSFLLAEVILGISFAFALYV